MHAKVVNHSLVVHAEERQPEMPTHDKKSSNSCDREKKRLFLGAQDIYFPSKNEKYVSDLLVIVSDR